MEQRLGLTPKSQLLGPDIGLYLEQRRRSETTKMLIVDMIRVLRILDECVWSLIWQLMSKNKQVPRFKTQPSWGLRTMKNLNPTYRRLKKEWNASNRPSASATWNVSMATTTQSSLRTLAARTVWQPTVNSRTLSEPDRITTWQEGESHHYPPTRE